MKRFTSSFSIKQTPKENDLIVSINENKKILFNKKKKASCKTMLLDTQKITYMRFFK